MTFVKLWGPVLLVMGLTRMGQLQADIDVVRAAWTKVPPKTGT